MRSIARAVLLIGSCALALAILAILAGPALAARGHVLAYQFGKDVNKTAIEQARPEAERDICPAPGHPGDVCQDGGSGSGPGELSGPSGVALDEATGVLYVVDKGNDRVERFDASTGAFLGQFDGGPTFEPSPGASAPTTEAGHGGLSEEVPSGVFDEPEGIAVDNSCHLHSPPLTGSACEAFDPSNGDVYVVDTRANNAHIGASAAVDKFGPTGAYLGQITRNVTGEKFSESGFRYIYGVAVDPRGEVWAYEENFGASPELVANYTNAQPNARVGSRRAEVAPGTVAARFAVDSTDHLYVGIGSGGPGDPPRIAKFTSVGNEPGETLAQDQAREFGTSPATGVVTEATTDGVYIDNGTAVRRYTPEKRELETLAVPGGHGTGVAVDPGPPGAGAGPVYVADSAADVVYAFAPEPPGPPTIEPGSTSVLDVTAVSAVLRGEINPRSNPGEAPTTYRFEYGPCQSFLACASSPYGSSTPVPAGELTANYEPDPLSAALAGLAPATTYHARLSAENSYSASPTLGEEVIFTTQAPGAAPLPDHRAYELVSPPEKHGALVKLPGGGNPIISSPSGDALTWVANAPTEASPPGFAQFVQVLSRRAGPATAPWLNEDISTPHAKAAGVTLVANEYQLFSEDLSRALVQPIGPFTPLSPEATETTPYLRSDFPPGEVSSPCLSGCYRPLVSAANVPAGTEFGETANVAGSGVDLLGASADASHVVLGSRAALVEGAPEHGLYEWSGGGLELISRNEAGTPIHTEGALAELALGSGDKTNGLGHYVDPRHAISTDGSRIVFSEEGEKSGHHLYLRDTTAEEGEGATVRLDKVQGGSGAGAVEPVFQDATPGDSRIFFTDTQQLVSGTSASGADLYECLIVEEEGEAPRCALTDLTAQGSGEAAGIVGIIPGASTDGSTVYFVADGRLTSEPGPGGEVAAAGGGCSLRNQSEAEATSLRCNLYERSGGITRLVAVLSGADAPDWGQLQQQPFFSTALLTARVSPSGRYLAFSSRLPLTGYDNRDAVSGVPDQEAFLYDADGNGGRGSLVCASCDPTGARPHGVEYREIDLGTGGGIAGGFGVWPDAAWIAASLPAWSSIRTNSPGLAFYQPRFLSDSGRLFFTAPGALAPGDSNGTEDVYQYEPPAGAGEPGSDTCTTSSSTFSPASGGCLSLISSGTSKEESAFMDASESGDDVFFLTSQRLSSRDEDTAADLYDARVGGGEVQAAKPVECSGDACQNPAVPPSDQTPGSLTFEGCGNVGCGNVTECPKGKVKKSGKCVARKHHKAKHKKKAHKHNGKKSKRTAKSGGGGQR